jgi:hypothetical protein
LQWQCLHRNDSPEVRFNQREQYLSRRSGAATQIKAASLFVLYMPPMVNKAYMPTNGEQSEANQSKRIG